MKIDSIELYHVSMPLIYPWRTAYGEDTCIDSVLVKMCSADQSGWGESAPFAAPCYSPEWASGVFGVLRRLVRSKICLRARLVILETPVLRGSVLRGG